MDQEISLKNSDEFFINNTCIDLNNKLFQNKEDDMF